MAKLTFTKANEAKSKNIMNVFNKTRDEKFIKAHGRYRLGFIISLSLNIFFLIKHYIF
jgi:hypothetical protein